MRKVRRSVDLDPSGPQTDPLENSASRDDVRVKFPATVGLGASWRISTPFTASVDVTRSFWSDAWIENYFDIELTGKPHIFPRLSFPTLCCTQEDSDQIRLGAEYVLARGRFKLPFRAGYINDRQYFRDITGDTPRFHSFTLGAGVVVGSFLIDFAYANERGSYVDQDGSGQHHRFTSHRFFGSIIYRH
jgi:long-subunit fatty acid transport protein